MNKDSKIFIAGARGMVGSAILRKLKALSFTNILIPSSKDLNILNQSDVESFFLENKPDYVFNAAAKVTQAKYGKNSNPDRKECIQKTYVQIATDRNKRSIIIRPAFMFSNPKNTGVHKVFRAICSAHNANADPAPSILAKVAPL